jgi:hypothetical protein
MEQGHGGRLNGASQWWLDHLQLLHNQSCSPRRDLSNAVSHSQFGRREEVDSRLLVVGSQTASLTPGPSFAHNLGCKCPNDQCEAIFNIYASRPFQWHQEHPNARCFGPCCRTLNIRESRRTPNPQLWECWASPPHFAKVGLRHSPPLEERSMSSLTLKIFFTLVQLQLPSFGSLAICRLCGLDLISS